MVETALENRNDFINNFAKIIMTLGGVLKAFRRVDPQRRDEAKKFMIFETTLRNYLLYDMSKITVSFSRSTHSKHWGLLSIRGAIYLCRKVLQ